MKKIVGILIAIIVAAPVLVLGVNEVRGSGIAFSNIKEIKASKSFVQDNIAEEFGTALDISIKSSRLSSIKRDENAGYTIVYKMDLIYQDNIYRNVTIELRGSNKQYKVWTIGCDSPAEEKILDVWQGL